MLMPTDSEHAASSLATAEQTISELAIHRQLHELQALHAIGRAVAANLALADVLQTIAEAISQHSPWQWCVVAYADHAAGVTRMVAGEPPGGIRDDQRSWPLAESPTLLAVSQRAPLVIHNTYEYAEYPRLQAAGLRYAYGGVIILPLLVEDFPCALWLYSKEPHQFTEQETQFAQAIADLVVVAVRNARLYEGQRQATARFSRLLHVQTDLIKRVLRGERLTPLAEATATMLGNPVIVLDQLMHSIATAPVAIAEPARAEAWSRYVALFGEASTVRSLLADTRTDAAAPLVELLEREAQGLNVPVRILVEPLALGEQALGYLIVADLGQPFQELDDVVCQEAGLAMAVELMRSYVAFQTENRLRSDHLHDLLTGSWVDQQSMMERAAFLGLDLEDANALLLIRLADAPLSRGDTHAPMDVHRLDVDRLVAQMAWLLTGQYAGGHAVRDERDIVVLLPIRGRPTSVLRRLADDLARLVEYTERRTPIVVIGPTCSSLTDYPRAWRGCRRALELCQAVGKTGPVNLGELGAYAFLISLENRGESRAFVEDHLGELLRYQEKRQTELIPTIRAYFQNNGSLEATAKQLFIHVSTLRYRLRRIQELTGLDLDDPDTRFSLQLALTLLTLTELPEQRTRDSSGEA